MADDTPFSFHCMICFESFHPEDRYPVVLPCGHTYVCIACANRLDKCMECRTPLYTMEPLHNGNNNGDHGQQSANGRRTGYQPRTLGQRAPHYQQQPWEPPPQKFKKRLPLPKNVVLLSLIEATELVTEDARKKYTESPRPSNVEYATYDGPEFPRPGVLEINSMIDMEEEEEEKIKVGASIAAGVAGTYAVAVRDGLEILPQRPRKSHTATLDPIMDASQTSHTDEEVENLMKTMQLSHQEQYNAQISAETKESGEPKTSPQTRGFSPAMPNARLSFGDRVQVVSVDGGWAKLARGYGYVTADKYQLVKVGGTLDRACALEAMLRTLSDKRKELRQQQARVDNHFIRVMKDLQLSLQSDEDLTVILASAFSDAVQVDLGTTNENHSNNYTTPTKSPKLSSAPELLPTVPEARMPNSSPQTRASSPPLYPEVVKPNKLNAEMQAVQQTKSNLSMMCFASDVFSSFDGCDTRGREVPRRNPEVRDTAYPSSPNYSREGATTPTIVNSLFPNASNPSPSAMRAGAQAWRDRHGRSVRNDTGSINFRTGMSGHMALLSTHAHAHQYLNGESSPTYYPTQYNNGFSSTSGSNNNSGGHTTGLPRMSCHTGLSMNKKNKKPTGMMGVLASLTLPSFGSASNSVTVADGTEHHDPQVLPRSGSM